MNHRARIAAFAFALYNISPIASVAKPPQTSTPENVKAANVTQTSPQIPRRTAGKNRGVDDFVPCLFDNGDIRRMRYLDDAPEPPKIEKQVPLDKSGAEAVAQIAQRVVTQAAQTAQAVTPKGKTPEQHADQNLLQFAQTLTPDVFENVAPENIATKLQSLAPPALIATNNPNLASTFALVQQVVVSIATGSKYPPPEDVSCSFSILQWKETSDTFGRRVANQYVAIEVNVRNLNQQNEFLIHDIQIAVDTGLNRAQFGRFQAARDKLIVRDVAQRGQTDDRRNLIINTLMAAGAIAGGASTAVTQGLPMTAAAIDLSSSVAIFQGPFITGVVNIFPDHTLEHINHINDLAFSASSTSKTVVPIQGSVPLVTFLSEKPLEQLPFAHCGKKFGRHAEVDPYTGGIRDAKQDPASSSYQFCRLNPYDQYDNPQPLEPAGDLLDPNYYVRPYPYRNWNGAAIEILERRVFVVIAGVHIKEVQKQPTLSGITCGPTNDATIDLAKIPGADAICTLKGSDLNLITEIVLENATDATDKIQANGKVTVSGDSTQAAATFATKDLAKLPGTSYKVYYSMINSSPQQTSLVLTVKQFVSLNPSSLNFGSQAEKSTSPAKTVVVSNNGASDIKITSMKSTGANAGDFSPTGPCIITLTPGKQCTIDVTFSPGGTGARSASINIEDSETVSPRTILVSGTGTAALPAPPAPAATPDVKLSPSVLKFTVPKGKTASEEQHVMLTNSGKVNLTITSIGLLGTDAVDFILTNKCGTSLGVTESCAITVVFQPNKTGPKTATVTIKDNASDSPEAIKLSGTS